MEGNTSDKNSGGDSIRDRTDRRETGFEGDRRAVLRGIAAAGITGFGVSGVSGAAAGQASSDELETLETEELDGGKAMQFATQAFSSEQGKEYKRYFKDEYGLVLTPNDSRVLRVSTSDETYHIVTLYGKETGRTDRTFEQASVSITIREGEIVDSKAGVAYPPEDTDDTDDETIEITLGTITDDQVTEESMILDLDGEVPTDGSVSIQSTSQCNLCKAVADAAGVIGCGWGMNTICALATAALSVPGGLTCVVVSFAVCDVITKSGRKQSSKVTCQIAGYC